MIELRNLHMAFSVGTADEHHLFRGVDLRIHRGDYITVIGSNGAGKTTLYNLISGQLSPSRGSILINGINVTKQPEHKRARMISRLFQDPLVGTAGNMFIEHNLLIAEKKSSKSLRISLNHQKREQFREYLRHLEMGLEDRMRDYVKLLSGGQRQALTLLMAVISRPEILLLDEHTAALDPSNAALVMRLTDRFIEEYHLTAMMVTHNMQQAIDHGNRILMMDRGEIILDIQGKEKKNLTVKGLVDKFHAIRKKGELSDEVLLTS